MRKYFARDCRMEFGMATVLDIYNYIDEIAPFSLAAKWDNSGLLIGDGHTDVQKCILSLDITSAVVDEAEGIGANLVISHHPVIFEPMRRIVPGDMAYKLIYTNMAAICAHTNLDVAHDGVNECLAKALKLTEWSPLAISDAHPYYKIVVFCPPEFTERIYSAMTHAGAGTLGNYSGCAFVAKGAGRFLGGEDSNPFKGERGKLTVVEEHKLELICPSLMLEAVKDAMLTAHPYEEPAYDIFETKAIATSYASGVVGRIPAGYPLTPEAFAGNVKKTLGCNGVRFVAGNRPIRTVAVCGGSGGSLLSKAIERGVDAFVTGDIKHDQMIKAGEAGITIVDAGHFATENTVIPVLREKLSRRFSDVLFCASETDTDKAIYL